ncbi:hypothetical protein [uncultured Sphingomonas sp.]|uniref:hypothetical protein n=1 Tax=uncultured Sphingomonas sp. TaxID=158754 RepID=UPI0025E486D1|nr:hypothetical protein [uncultured Sphingomonas sp.]
MGEKTREQVFLCVVEHEGEPFPRGFRAGTSVDDLAKWADEKNSPPEEKTKRAKSAKNDKTPSLSDLMENISSTGNHQSELISVTSAVISSFPMTLFKSEVVSEIFKDRKPERVGENYRIGRILDNQVSTVIETMSKINRLRDGLEYLPTAIFLSLIATFDTQMSDIVRAMLRIKSDRLKMSARQIPLSKIMAAKDIQEIVEEQIIEEVYLFSRGSHDDQVAFIEENFSIEIRKSWKRWPDFIEIFERRNLVAHGERSYTKRYVDICLSHGFDDAKNHIGNKVRLNRSYLYRSLSILSEFALLTIFMLWRKHVPNERDEAFDAINEISFSCINNHRYRLASRLCEFALSLKNSGIKEAQRLRIVVNLASSHMHMKENEEAEKVLNREDWSATSDDFQISVAALRKEVKEVNRILPMIKASGRLDADEFRTWPVFNFIKEDQEFLDQFKKVYGEPLIVTEPVVENSEQPNRDCESGIEEDNATMH